MDCKRVQELLLEKEERQLAAWEEDALRAHLAECAECRSVARGLRSLDRLLNEWQVPQAPADLPLRVMSRLDSEDRTRAAAPVVGFAWLQRAFLPLVVAAGLVLGFLLGSQLEHVARPGHSTVATNSQELELFSDPPSGSLTEAFEAVTLASTGR